MNRREIVGSFLFLVAASVVNWLWALLYPSWGIPVRIEFVIVAYCVLVMALSLRPRDAAAIGFAAGVLTILASPAHLTTIFGGQATLSGMILALSNLASEPVGAASCAAAFAYLAGKAARAAPFAAGFIATLASGLVYILFVSVFSAGLLTGDPTWAGKFVLVVGQTAVANAIFTGILFLAAGERLRIVLTARSG